MVSFLFRYLSVLPTDTKFISTASASSESLMSWRDGTAAVVEGGGGGRGVASVKREVHEAQRES